MSHRTRSHRKQEVTQNKKLDKTRSYMKRISNTKQEVTQNKRLHMKIQGKKLHTKDVQNKRLHKVRSCTEKNEATVIPDKTNLQGMTL